MRKEVRVSLSSDLVAALDARLKNREDASEFIEEAVRRSLARQTRDEDSDRDIEIINRNARQLNEEAEDVLEYQALS
jgi:metal-responsive CopG/Arc/MetJ family transcriptional regulator